MFSSRILKQKLATKIQEKHKILKEFKGQYANHKVGEITIGQVVGGMRGMLGLIYQTSKLHPVQGINYRGQDLFEIIKKCHTAPGGT
jgi:citrate synthase